MGLSAMKRKNTRENLFSALSISYIAIFILSFVVGIVIILLSQKQTRDSIYDYNMVLVNKIQESIDPIYDNVCEYARGFGRDAGLVNILGRDDLSENNYRDLMQVIKTIDDYRTRNEYIHDIFVYSQASDIIVGSSVQRPENFFSTISQYDGFTYEDWQKQFLNQKQYNRFYPVEKIKKTTGDVRVVTFANTMYIENQMIGTLIIQIDADMLVKDVFLEEIEKGSSIYILDKTKRPILAYGYTEGDIEAIPFVDTEKKSCVNNGDRIVIFDISSHNRWIYATAIPEGDMFRSLVPMKIYFFLIMFIYAVSGAVIFVVAIRNNNKRLRIVLKKIGIKEYDDSGNVGVADIISGIEDLVANNEALTERVYSKEEYIRRSVLLDVLSGKNDNDCKKKLRDAGIVFESELFGVAVIEVEDEGLLKSDDLTNLSRICIVNVFSEMLDKLCKYIIAEPDTRHIAVVLNPDTGEEFEKKLAELCTQFKTILSAEFEMTVEIGISSLHKDEVELNKLYEEALIALEYKTAPGRSAVFYKDITDEKERIAVYYYPSEIEEKIINCVCAGDEINLVQILENLIDKNIRDSGIMRQSKNCFYYDLLGTYIKAAEIIGYNSENTYKLVSKMDDNYISVKNRVSMLCDELVDLCRFSHKLQDVGVDKTAEKIKKYVEDNYSDINLCVLSVADKFELSRQTVSKKFSQAFDVTLNDYITDVRVTKAKELLETTNLSGHQIAEMVGYIDSSTFIRVFKKQYGITPGQYKKNIMMHK